ncbi:MAG TPA: TIGR00282 family metallophosphoesterase [Dissulfurispiraceae bacterium]|nr:TIGR00282 family metallophosphoesterase [Dissulfurispiraceae bacterium]
MKALFIGDIVGRIGRVAVRALLPNIVSRYKIDAVIANGENIAGGFGITEPTTFELLTSGVQVITTGNHVWDKKEVIEFIDREPRLLRPLNYPPGAPGASSAVLELPQGKLAVLNVSGRVFMQNLDCPFRTAKEEIKRLREITPNILIDFHAEATSEKIAFGYYVAGTVTAVIGTHTHVQTADEKLLEGGTAYITDVGMTGPIQSVIGVERQQIIERFLLQMPRKFDIAGGKALLCGVIVEFDPANGHASAIHRLQLTHP